MRPVATGGMTSGSATSVSTSDLPGHFARASSQASAMPKGRMSSVLSAAVPSVKPTTCASSPFISFLRDETVSREDGQRVGRTEIIEEFFRRVLVLRAFHQRGGINNGRAVGDGHFIR